jgi:hypothetical protein
LERKERDRWEGNENTEERIKEERKRKRKGKEELKGGSAIEVWERKGRKRKGLKRYREGQMSNKRGRCMGGAGEGRRGRFERGLLDILSSGPRVPSYATAVLLTYQ